MDPALVGSVILAAGIAVVAATALLRPRLRRERRNRIMSRPFPDDWEKILQDKLPLYNKLPNETRDRLRRSIQVFLDEKVFEGCGGLEVTSEMQVLVAAQACLLLLNGNGDFYPLLRSILIYPAAYRTREARVFTSLQDDDFDAIHVGESWSSGSVVLSWKDVKQGTRDGRDGYNVVIHEFAHQLDQASGDADGAPPLHHRDGYHAWSKVLSEAYQEFLDRLERGRHTVFDDYGSSAPEEFFAVATETFFEKPRQLKKSHPALYDEFRSYYGLDPAAWG